MTVYDIMQDSIKTVMCADTAGIVMSYLDYRIPEEEVKHRMKQVIDSLQYNDDDDDDDDDSDPYYSDDDREIINVVSRLFRREYFCYPVDIEHTLVGHHDHYSNFDSYLSINELLSLPTSERYIHPNKTGSQLFISLTDQLTLHRILKRLKTEFNAWKHDNEDDVFRFVIYSKNRFTRQYHFHILKHEVANFDRLINDWDYKRPYYFYKRLEGKGIQLIDFRHQLERIDLHNDLTEYFMKLDLPKYVRLRGLSCIEKINAKTIKIKGKNRKYKETVSNRSQYLYYNTIYNTSLLQRIGMSVGSKKSDYQVTLREVCIDRKWKCLGYL